MLAKYMSGMATPEEEEAVLAYLSENEENLEDFKNMGEAVMLNDFASKKETKSRQRFTRYLYAAAAIALLVIVCLVAINRNPNQNDQFAQQSPNKETTDTTVVQSTNNIKEPTNSEAQSQISTSERMPSTMEPKHYADSSHKSNYANMVYPTKKRTMISKEKKNVNFRWNTDAVGVHLSVRSDDGKWVKDMQLAKEKYFTVSLPENVDTLMWHVVFTYDDGTSSEESGMIMRWDMGLKLNEK